MLFTLAALLALGPAGLHGKGKQPKRTDGTYNVTVAGPYTGSGNATVGGKSMVLRIQVKDEAGRKGEFSVDAQINGAHFRGDGTVMGKKLTLTGRLDGYDQTRGFKGARLLGNYVDADGKAGRVAGVIE